MTLCERTLTDVTAEESRRLDLIIELNTELLALRHRCMSAERKLRKLRDHLAISPKLSRSLLLELLDG